VLVRSQRALFGQPAEYGLRHTAICKQIRGVFFFGGEATSVACASCHMHFIRRNRQERRCLHWAVEF